MEYNFCPECGEKALPNSIRCMKCGFYFVELDEPLNSDILFKTNHKSVNINVKHIEEKGLSFDYPEYYLIANAPSNNPDCVVALAKNDDKCDIMVEISSEPKMIYQEGIFENQYIEYIKNLGFYDIKVIRGFGYKKLCFEAYGLMRCWRRGIFKVIKSFVLKHILMQMLEL